MRRVHGEATECIVFIERVWTEHAMKTRPGIPQNRGNDFVFDRPCSKRDPVGRGLTYRKMEETDLVRLKGGSC